MKNPKLIDVVHLYIGQRIISYIGKFSESDVRKGVIGGLVIFKTNSDDEIQDSLDLHYKFKKGQELRPMSEMKAPYKMVAYCIKQGFDVFGLIESGQAINL